MKKIIALVMTAALLLTALVGCSKGSSGGTVSTDGSTSMEKVIGALGEAFEALQDSLEHVVGLLVHQVPVGQVDNHQQHQQQSGDGGHGGADEFPLKCLFHPPASRV